MKAERVMVVLAEYWISVLSYLVRYTVTAGSSTSLFSNIKALIFLESVYISLLL